MEVGNPSAFAAALCSSSNFFFLCRQAIVFDRVSVTPVEIKSISRMVIVIVFVEL